MLQKTRIAFFIVILGVTHVIAQNTKSAAIGIVPKQVLVHINRASTLDFLAHAQKNQTTISPIATDGDLYLLDFQADSLAEQYLAEAQSLSFIQSAQRNHYIETRTTPNDTDYEIQWDMTKIGMEAAWDLTKGGTNTFDDTIVVAVLDKGFQLTHEDLQQNTWYNRNEIPNNGIDDDHNGYIDDINGWNFGNNNNNVSSAIDHGTQVAGIIGADGNNQKGVSGVNQNVKMMFLSGMDTEVEVLKAYHYALNMRRRYEQSGGREGSFVVVTNASFGRTGTAAQAALWCAMYDSLGKSGILSVGATSNASVNVDVQADIPSNCSSPYLIVVTNTDNNDRLQAAYSRKDVDLSAPGDRSHTIYWSPTDNNLYGNFFGTSAATPHVTGAVALLYTMPGEIFAADQHNKPAETALIVKSAILQGVDKIQALKEKTASGGRLNVAQSLSLLDRWYTKGEENSFLNLYPNPSNGQVTLSFLQNNEPIAIQIFDAIGREVYTQNIVLALPTDGNYTLDCSRLAYGFHSIFVRFSDGSTAVKYLIKQ